MDAKNVTASKPKKGGAVFVAPLGTPLPTDTVTALDKDFTSLGYCSTDGLINANSPTSDSTKAWGGETVLNNETERPDNFRLKLIEALNVNVLKTVYGEENVTGDLENGIAVAVGNEEHKEHAWVVDMVLKNGAAKRIVVPQAKITAMEEIVYNDNTPVGYGLTLGTTPDTKGKSHYEYIKGSATEDNGGEVSA